MTPAQLRQYARTLILESARDIEFLDIYDMAGEHAPGGTITEAEAGRVSDLIERAIVTVTWPEDQLPPRHANVVSGSVSGTLIQARDMGSIHLGTR